MTAVRVLGPIEIGPPGAAVAAGGRRQLAVLGLLVVHRERSVSVDALAEGVWPDAALEGAAKRVQVAVARLRRTLAPFAGSVAIETVAGGYRLHVEPGALDVDEFTGRVHTGRAALAAGDPLDAVDRLRAALALWRGPAFADIADHDFARDAAAELDALRLAALEARFEADLALGEATSIAEELEAHAAANPDRERAVALLMRALYIAGRQADALEAFQRTRAHLAGELGLEPGPELQELQGRILRHDPTLRPETTAARTTVRNRLASHAATADARVPQPPNATVGRDADVAAIVGRLQDGRCRLLTLTGPGGVGKTRIALEVSRSAAPAFADGARFVSLADVGRAEDVAAAISRALGIVPLAGEPDESAVVRVLAAKDLLLVLDNLEQILPAASLIARLLDTTSGLTILATSREPLRLRAEECRPIAPLGLPAREASNDPDRIRLAGAVALFCQRATARMPGFVLDAANAAAVAEICRRVDGLPLALELAAARCGLLSPREIADRLDAELGALGSAPRDAPARQRTLRETIDWSHALLTDEEQATFARFAVFAGGATVDAAEAVTASSLDALDSLVAKSLLVRRGHARAATRLHTLETTHAYARERLAAAPDRHAVHARHHRFFAELARAHGSDQSLMRADRADHLARLDAESDNLEAALAWALREGDAPRALELCGALGMYWAMRHRGPRVWPRIEEALQLGGATDEVRIEALLARLWCSPSTQIGLEAKAVEAEALARALEDPLLLSRALEARTDLEVDLGRIDVAASFADSALREAQTAGDEWQIAAARRVRARAARNASDRREQIERAASALAAVGNVFDLGNLFVSAAYGALRDGSDALEFAERAMPVVRALDEPFMWMNVRANIGLAALAAGDLDAAAVALREALELSRWLVVPRIAAEMMVCLGALAAIDGDTIRAARLVGAAAAHAETDPPDIVTPGIVAPSLDDARARLGADRWDAGVREGGAFGFDEAIAYALEESPAS